MAILCSLKEASGKLGLSEDKILEDLRVEICVELPAELSIIHHNVTLDNLLSYRLGQELKSPGYDAVFPVPVESKYQSSVFLVLSESDRERCSAWSFCSTDTFSKIYLGIDLVEEHALDGKLFCVVREETRDRISGRSNHKSEKIKITKDKMFVYADSIDEILLLPWVREPTLLPSVYPEVMGNTKHDNQSSELLIMCKFSKVLSEMSAVEHKSLTQVRLQLALQKLGMPINKSEAAATALRPNGQMRGLNGWTSIEDYHSDSFKVVLRAWERFWKSVELENKKSYTSNHDVTKWISTYHKGNKIDQKCSISKENAMFLASIIRPDAVLKKKIN